MSRSKSVCEEIDAMYKMQLKKNDFYVEEKNKARSLYCPFSYQSFSPGHPPLAE